jgi:hypothetical protein
MSVSNDSPSTGTIDDSRALLTSIFLEFCVKVRNNDPSILPEYGKSFKIRQLSEEKVSNSPMLSWKIPVSRS